MAKKEKVSVVVGILDKLELEHSEKISDSRAKAKLERAIEADGLPEDIELDKAEIEYLKGLGYEIELEGDEEAEEEEVEETKEIEVTKSKKKSSKKKPEPKKEKGKSKGAGVIATVVEMLQNSKRPLTHQQIVDKLSTKFPDRSPEGMMKTVKIQVPNRLSKEKGLKIKKDDKGGFIIN
jgi:hypothetical protein